MSAIFAVRGRKLTPAIRSLLETHPGIAKSRAGHTEHSFRYITRKGAWPIGLEPDRVRFQNLWVRADSVDLSVVDDIAHETYDHDLFDITKPNHSLFGEKRFKNADLIRFKVTELWQAVRVILDVAGEGGKP